MTLKYDGGPFPWPGSDGAEPDKQHTVDGKTSDTGWAYGVTHDRNCPACEDTPYLLSPRSETYWSS